MKSGFNFKKIETEEDMQQAYQVYKSNPEYFQIVSSKEPVPEDVKNDMQSIPENTDRKQKYYGLYKEDGHSIAVVDMIEGFPEPDVFYIGLFMIDGAVHRKGIGRRLYRMIEKSAVARGYTRIRLGVVDGNEKAMSFWTVMGFVEVETIHDTKEPDTGWTIHVMEKGELGC